MPIPTRTHQKEPLLLNPGKTKQIPNNPHTQSCENKANTKKKYIYKVGMGIQIWTPPPPLHSTLLIFPCDRNWHRPSGSLPLWISSITALFAATVDLLNNCAVGMCVLCQSIETAHRGVQLLCQIIKSKPNLQKQNRTVHNLES